MLAILAISGTLLSRSPDHAMLDLRRIPARLVIDSDPFAFSSLLFLYRSMWTLFPPHISHYIENDLLVVGNFGPSPSRYVDLTNL